jgi:hypothetical protein
MPVQFTLFGLTMGAATNGDLSGITIKTSADPIVSPGIDSGAIFPPSNAADISMIISSNSPGSGSVHVAVFGRAGFRTLMGKFLVILGETTCVNSFWVSDSSVVCRVARAGARNGLSVVISSAFQTGSMSSAFSYNAACLSALGVGNIPKSGSLLVNLHGTGGFISSARAKVGLTACTSILWSSSSSLVCKFGQGINAASKFALGMSQIVVTSERQLCSQALTCSFNVDILSSVAPHTAASTGSSLVKVDGAAFSVHLYSPSSRYSSTASSATIWTSDSCLEVRIGTGIFSANNHSMIITAGTKTASLSSALSYNVPLTRGVMFNMLRNISIFGANFGTFPVVVSRIRNCNGAIIARMQTADVCLHDDLAIFKDSPIPISSVSVTISFFDVFRFEFNAQKLFRLFCKWRPITHFYIFFPNTTYSWPECCPRDSLPIAR